MAIFDLFSKKQKRQKSEISDVYSYDTVPDQLRVQVVHIIRDCLGVKKAYADPLADDAYEFIFKTLCREYGRFTLVQNINSDRYGDQVLNFLLQTKSTDEVLDTIDLTFKYIDRAIRREYHHYVGSTDVKATPDEAISELNERFKENAIGYAFEGGEMIRVDSTYVHAEITKPTLALLSNKKFSGANEEYIKAHEHYRHGRNKECLSECLKAFESTLKIICHEKKWTFANTDTAKRLIQICLQNNLVPTFTQNQFTSLQNLLESGIPTIRNKLGGHGQGISSQNVDDEMTRYGLNLTGTNIIFLIEQSGI